jgi:signal transduction histidine kinase
MTKDLKEYLPQKPVVGLTGLNNSRESLLEGNMQLITDLMNSAKAIRTSLHDLTQPLSVITGTVDLLLMELDEHSEVTNDIKKISDQLELIFNIIDDLRGVTRHVSEIVAKP